MLYLILAIDIDGKEDLLIVSANMVERVMDRLMLSPKCVFCMSIPMDSGVAPTMTDIPSIMRPQAGDIWRRH